MTIYTTTQTLRQMLSIEDAENDRNAIPVTIQKINGGNVNWASEPYIVTVSSGHKVRFWEDVDHLVEIDDNGDTSINPTPDGTTGDDLVLDGITITTTDGSLESASATLTLTLHGGVDTGSAPSLTSMVPAASATGVSVSVHPVLTADQTLVAGTGSVTTRNVTDGTDIETFAIPADLGAGAGQITVSGQTFTVNPTADFPAGKQISIRMTAGAFENASGNGLPAVTDDTWSFTTAAAAGAIPETVTPDVTVSSLSALEAQLAAWAGANWNGSTPSGKTNSDGRVIGVDTSFAIGGRSWDYSFPQLVQIRPVGTFSNSGCSVNHTINGPIGITFTSGCQNLHFWRCDFRAASGQSFSNGMFKLDGCTNVKFRRCAARGQTVDYNVAACVTSYFYSLFNGATDCGHEFLYASYFRKGVFYTQGMVYSPIFKSAIHQYFSDDDQIFSGKAPSGSGVDGHVVDPILEAIYGARTRNVVNGEHPDLFQINKGGGVTRATIRYMCALLGEFIPIGGGDPAWQGLFNDQSNIATNPTYVGTGPHLYTQNYLGNGHKWAILAPGGTGTKTGTYNSCIRPYVTEPSLTIAPGGQMGGFTVVQGNAQNFQNSGAINGQAGTPGLNTVLAASATLTDFQTAYASHFENVPQGILTDLYDVRPKTTSPFHPDYTPAGDRIGCWEFWKRLWDKNPDQLLSEAGWPVAAPFIADFDRANGFGSSYTGTYDSNGWNA